MTIVCPYQDCQQQLAIEPQHAGSEANCPTCRRPMMLPELAAFPVEEVDPAPWAIEDPAPVRTPAPVSEDIPATTKESAPPSHKPSTEAVSEETTRVNRPAPATSPAVPPTQSLSPSPTNAEPAPEDLVPNLISRSAPEMPEPTAARDPGPSSRLGTDTAPQNTLPRHSSAPPQDRRNMPPEQLGSDSNFGDAAATQSQNEAAREQPFTPGGGAGCPKCMHAFDDAAQEFVRELVELRETGIGVGKIGVKCACGTETQFENLLWIKNGAASEPHPASRKSVTRPTFHPPNSRRDRAKIFSDAGFAAVERGDTEKAHAKWLRATEADESWSIPFFNLARLSLDQGDHDAAIIFLGMAEDRAQGGSDADDAQVIKQVPFLKSRLKVKA